MACDILYRRRVADWEGRSPPYSNGDRLSDLPPLKSEADYFWFQGKDGWLTENGKTMIFNRLWWDDPNKADMSDGP